MTQDEHSHDFEHITPIILRCFDQLEERIFGQIEMRRRRRQEEVERAKLHKESDNSAPF